MGYDLLIRGGTVVDGSGLPGYRADVAVSYGTIVEVGKLTGAEATRVVDADGLVVAPGFIDPHTHLDPQLCWDPLGMPSINHGVTTVMTGNCSVTVAPCRAQDREAIAVLFHQLEEVPLDTLTHGLTWQWESFGEYLDLLDESLGVNVAAMVGHSALRYYVMGPDVYERSADDHEIHQMREVLRQALMDGAAGFSTSGSEFAVLGAGPADPELPGHHRRAVRDLRRAGRDQPGHLRDRRWRGDPDLRGARARRGRSDRVAHRAPRDAWQHRPRVDRPRALAGCRGGPGRLPGSGSPDLRTDVPGAHLRQLHDGAPSDVRGPPGVEARLLPADARGQVARLPGSCRP